MCDLPYILLLEEDWILGPISFPIISHAIEVLRSAPSKVFGLTLSPLHLPKGPGGLVQSVTVKSPYMSPAVIWVFIKAVMLYTNNPSVYRMDIIRKILQFGGYKGEGQFSDLAREMGYTLALIRDKPHIKVFPRHTWPYFYTIGICTSRTNKSLEN
jgi:hypothetical protein